MNTQIDISPRLKQLKAVYERLQQVYAELIAKRDDLTEHEIPRLEALYMDAIGQMLYEELCLQYDIALLKSERDLLQAYINRGEEPDIEDVEEKVGQQAQTFNENIHREEERINQAKAYIEEHKEENSKDAEAEKLELKQIYKRLVRRLHPDLHPEQTEWERELFMKVQEAYRNEDLERLRELEAELDAGMPSSDAESDSIEEWEKRVECLKQQIADIEKEIYEIEHEFPFTYREKLNDQEWIVAQREEINVRIEKLKQEKERLQKIVEILRQTAK